MYRNYRILVNGDIDSYIRVIYRRTVSIETWKVAGTDKLIFSSNIYLSLESLIYMRKQTVQNFMATDRFVTKEKNLFNQRRAGT